MVKRVSCGAVVNGVQLTTLKEMARCEKSDLARSRAVPTNSGQRVEKVLTVKDIKAVKKFVFKRIDEDNDGVTASVVEVLGRFFFPSPFPMNKITDDRPDILSVAINND